MRFFFFLILTLVTSVLYFKKEWRPGFFEGWFKPAISKKVRAVKPKSLVNKLADLKSVSHQFTFFETLQDKTMTKYVGLNGEILPVSPPFKPVILPSKGERNLKRNLHLSKKKLEIKDYKKLSWSTERYFTVQIGSFRNENRADELKMKLRKKGFDSFLMETELPNHGGKWFRVFLGKYSDENLAHKDAELLRQEYKVNAIVVRKTFG
jgi:hypothetical protein